MLRTLCVVCTVVVCCPVWEGSYHAGVRIGQAFVACQHEVRIFFAKGLRKFRAATGRLGGYSHEGKSGGYFMEAKKVVLYFNVIFCKIITRKGVAQNWSFLKKFMRGI